MEVLIQAFICDDLRARFFEAFDIPRVVLMNVRHDRVLHRLRRDSLNLSDEIVIELIAEVLRINENHALIRDADRGVASGAGNHVDAWLDLFDHLALRLRGAAAAGLSAACIATASTACVAATALAVTARSSLSVAAPAATAWLLTLRGLPYRNERRRCQCKRRRKYSRH